LTADLNNAHRDCLRSRPNRWSDWWLAVFAVGCAVPAAAQDQASATEIAAPGTGETGSLALPKPPPEVSLPEVEPVIPDDEFDELVPDFEPGDDPEFDRPLETIEEFEQRLAGELQAGAQGEAIPDDPALSEPLAPLEAFRFDPAEFAAQEDTGESSSIDYAVRVTGLAAADAETDADLEDLFDDLSTLNGGSAANVAQVNARLEEDRQLLRSILESEGWYDPRIETRIDHESDGERETLVAVIDAVPGWRFTFGSITVNAGPTVPPRLIEDNLQLMPGEAIVAERVLAAEARVALVLPQTGYPFAELGQRSIVLDRETGEGDYTLPVETGPRSVFDGIRVTGDPVFDADHIRLLARWQRDELYDSRKVDDLRKALVATGLFNTVSVSAAQTGEPAGEDAEYAAIVVDQQAGPPRTIAGRVGYGTGEGFRLEGSWTHRNLFPPEGALIVTGVAGTNEQSLGVTFRRSNAGRRDRTFQLMAEVGHSSYDAFNGYTARLAGLISYDSTPIWQKTLTYSYGGQALVTAEEDFDLDRGERRRRTFYIAGLTGQAGLDFTDDLLDPTGGFRLTALVEPEALVQNGFRPYLRARIDGSAYYSPTDSLVLAGRVRFGTIQGIDRFDLAPSRRFYAGGAGSVRGFGYHQLGPQVMEPNPKYDPADPEEQDPPLIDRPLGGLSVAEASAEVRYRFGDYGAVAFVDIGQAYDATFPRFSDLRVGVGLGARYYTNFGPLRVDVATPLNRRPGEGRLNVYVSIGQAF
jgi:translocation and assembly module TamA